MTRSKQGKVKLFISYMVFFVLSVSLLNMIGISSVNADSNTNYYVSNDGNDSNTGLSSSNAWRTINKVNSELNGGVIDVGDNIYFRRGDTFSGELDLRRGGTSSNYMVVGAYGSGNRPIIDNNGGSGYGTCIDLFSGSVTGYYQIQDLHLRGVKVNLGALHIKNEMHHVKVSNVYIDNIPGGLHKGVFVSNAHDITLQNVDCHGASIMFYGDGSYGIRNTKVIGCSVDGEGIANGIVYHRSDGGNVGFGANHYIANCEVSDTASGHKAYVFGCGSDYIVENCIASGTGQAGFGVNHDVSNIVIQYCTVYDYNSVGFSIETLDNAIIRYNNVWNTYYDTLKFETNNGDSWANEDGYTRHLTLYNNNFMVPNYWTGTINRMFAIDYDYFEDTFIKNNIFVSYHSSKPSGLFRVYGGVTIPPEDDVTFDSNMWYHGSGSDANKWYNGNTNMNLAAWRNYYPSDDFDNPELKNPHGGDYSLTSSSPCVDAGAFLTYTSGSGSGTQFTVYDASYFTDGFGIITGDSITVGSDTGLIITDVNYGTNKITVDRSFSWSNGDAVSLDYEGSAPDIGSYELSGGGGDSPPDSPPIITNIDAQPNPQSSGEWVDITCTVTGDAPITDVRVFITDPNNNNENKAMTGNGDSYLYDSKFYTVGTYEYYIQATDANGNTQISPSYSFVIENDNPMTPPIISEVTYTESNPVDTDEPYGWIRISCRVTDDDLNKVNLIYTDETGMITNVTMNEAGSNMFYYNTTFNVPGDYSYYIWSNDVLGLSSSTNNYYYWVPANWDINSDGVITVLDITMASNHFGDTGNPGWIREDVNNDGEVNMLDLVIISNHLYSN